MAAERGEADKTQNAHSDDGEEAHEEPEVQRRFVSLNLGAALQIKNARPHGLHGHGSEP